MTPLVSCLTPTADRRAHLPRAIVCFLRQTHEPRELLILDDGHDPVQNLIPPDPRIRYVRLPRKLSLGAKRNEAVRLARGDLLMHWDDDDWHAPHRIAYQLDHLLRARADICGLRRMLFHDVAADATFLYDYPAAARPWLARGSLLYTRDFWRRAPFPDLTVGEDTRFIWGQRLHRYAVPPDHRFYVAMIHPGNTSPKQTRGPHWSPSPEHARAVMADDFPRYRGPAATRATVAAPDAADVPDAPVAPDRHTPMKLNLGCCDALLPGFVNVDVVESPGVLVVDLARPWPWADDSADLVRGHDVIEHLPDKIFTMNELWRVLKPGARAELAVPTTDGPGAFQDPTHVSFWNRRSFLYYEAGNPYRGRFARHYGIRCFRIVQERTDRTPDEPRLTIVLEAVKP